ncbi:MAG: CBS domain-containing protein [Gammaproteobacteria bacterium]|nr:CBS domain-containing protein [Gammaproteobacteria bacterium]
MSKTQDSDQPMRTARDLMIPLDAYPIIRENATLAEAIATFVGAAINRKGKLSLPRILLVFDEAQALVGVVRRRHIICGLLPGFLTRQEEPHAEAHFDIVPPVDLDLADLFRDEEHKVLSANAQAPVATVMHDIGAVVEADDDLMELIKQTAQTHSHILPVMENGQVLGVVRTVELLSQIHRILKL